VVAASTTSFRSPNCEVWTILGHNIPELKAPKATITTDGNILASEWGENLPIFVGHRSKTNLSAAVSYDEQNLYFCAKVKDEKRIFNSVDGFKSDGVNVYIDSENHNLLSPDTGLFKIWCNHKGEVKILEGNKGKWEEINANNLQIKAISDNTSGYELELGIPFSVLKKQNKSDIRLNIGLVEYASPGSGYEENITNSTSSASNTWVRIAFQ
jgi:hypothetical protein